MQKLMNEKIIPKIMAFINLKGIQAIKDGMVYSMPLLIVGSVFLIITNFPVQAVVDVLEETGIKAVLEQANGATFNISAMIAVLGISYNYIKLEGQEPLSGAIIVGLIVGSVYCWFLKKDIRIKMPAGVPEGVSNAFSALIPGAVIVVGATVIHGICFMGFHTTAMELIYNVIQTPLQGMTDSIGGALLMCFLTPFLWFFGVHGSTIVGGIMTGILQANSLENQALIDQGIELTVENGGHIVTMQFFDQFINVTGAGLTIGLVIYMFFMAKSKQMKTLGRLEMVPALFNINEPVLFGLPIVMNPVLAFPFIAMPVISCILQYAALYTGLCPLYGATQVPWTCPPIISGFLIGGWRTALLQLVIFIISFFVYLPFAKRVDKLNLVKEAEAEKEGNDDDW